MPSMTQNLTEGNYLTWLFKAGVVGDTATAFPWLDRL
jgi:hypothetical protein